MYACYLVSVDTDAFLLYEVVQVLEVIPLNCTSSVLRLFVMPTSSLIVLSTFGIHYPMTLSPHALLLCSNVNIAPFVFFISLIIVYCDHLHIFPYSSFSFCILCCFVLSSIVFRASVSAGFPALKSCLTLHLSTFGIHYPMSLSPHALLLCSNVNIAPFVFSSV